jgi:phosphoglycerate dehydrogenase-like enzyme
MSDIDVVLHPVLPPGVSAVLAASPGIKRHRPADNAGVAAALASGVPVLVGHTWRAEFMQPTLRWMAGTGAGTDPYPLDPFRQRGVVLTTALGVHSACVAEHGFALLLSLTRWVGEAVRNMPVPSWQPLVGEALAGKRLGDETALLQALQFGGLRGAALDVTGIEPLPAAAPLWRLPQVVITAHNVGDGPGYGPRWGRLFERNLAAFVGSGSDWVNRADGGDRP